MTHELYLIIICTIVAAGIIIIGKLYDRIEKLKAELDDADAELRELDLICLKARRSNEKASADIEKLNTQLDVMGKRLAEYNNDAKNYKTGFIAATTENKELKEQMRRRLEHIQELESKISQLGHVVERQAEMIDLCSKSLDEAQERKDNEIRTKKGKRLIRRK